MHASLRNHSGPPGRRLPWSGRPVRQALLGLCSILGSSALLMMPVTSCGSFPDHPQPAQDSSAPNFRIESTEFKQGEDIPKKFTCVGDDSSPELRWTAPPTGTRSFALIVDDPDAPSGTWVHWVIYDLPAAQRELPGGQPKQDQMTGGARQGRNDFGRIGYGGPCPPAGSTHRYYFKLYALDIQLGLQPGATKQDVLAAAKGHVLAEAQLMARFKS